MGLLMRLLPYRRVELQSPLPVTSVIQALSEAVEAPRSSWLDLGSRPFEGTVTRNEFRIYRVIGYRNSFRPRISGTVSPDGHGSRISVTMQLHEAVAVFMVIWLGIVFWVCVAFFTAVLEGSASFEPPLLIAPGMLVFGWLLCLGGFGFEARKAERLITSLVEARPA